MLLFCTAFITCLVAHEVADHLLQPDRLAQAKTQPGRRGWMAAVLHAVLHAVLTGTLLAVTDRALGASYSTPGFWAGIALILVSHAVIDRRWPVRRILELTGAAGFARLTTPVSGMYLADQSLHKLFLFIGSLLIATL